MPPLRVMLMDDLRSQLDRGNINYELPRFKENRSLKRSETKLKFMNEVHLNQTQVAKMNGEPIFKNPLYKNVYQAMKQSRIELDHAISAQKRVFFEAEPLEFRDIETVEEKKMRYEAN